MENGEELEVNTDISDRGETADVELKVLSLAGEEKCSNVDDINFDTLEAEVSGFPKVNADSASLEYGVAAKM